MSTRSLVITATLVWTSVKPIQSVTGSHMTTGLAYSKKTASSWTLLALIALAVRRRAQVMGVGMD